MRKTYRIECYYSPLNKWMLFGNFDYMQKSFAEGAFCMLKNFYGGDKKYRLISSEGIVVDEWNTGHVVVN